MDPPSIIYPSQSTNDEGLGASDDNGPEMKEPQLCGNDQVQVDAVINDQQQQQQHTTNQPQHYNLLSSPIPSFQQVVHIPTPQQLAQKMLVARRGGSNNNRWKNDDEKLFGSELVLPIIPPPWEVSIDNNCTTNVATNNDAGNTTTFPAAQSDLPMSPLHQMTTTTLPLPVPITGDTPNVILSNGTIDHNYTPHIITNNTNNNNGNTSNNEQPPLHHHDHHQTTTPTRVTTKNVTFNTHDKLHTYDVHLETLKHVDAEFFNVAYYLMDVVNVDIGNIEYYMSSSIEDEEEKGGERLRRMEGEEGLRGGGGKKNYAALQYEATSNNGQNGQSSSTSATTVGCTGGSVLSKLFSCGMIDISSNMFNFNDDDEEEIIISQKQRKELEENSILRQQHQEQEQQHNNNNRRTKKRMYQLTNKLVNDFVLAVKYRMEIIENEKETTYSSVVVEGEANKNNINNTSTTTTSEVDADDAVKRTKEIARKMYAYGLPLVGMIPHPKDIDDDEEEGDAIGLSAAAHNNQKNDNNGGTLTGDKKVDDDFVSPTSLSSAFLCKQLSYLNVCFICVFRWIHLAKDHIVVNTFLYCPLIMMTTMKINITRMEPQMKMISMHPTNFTSLPKEHHQRRRRKVSNYPLCHQSFHHPNRNQRKPRPAKMNVSIVWLR